MSMIKPLTLIEGKVLLKVSGKYEEISAMSREEVKRKFWGSDITIIPQSAMNALMPTIGMSKYVEHLAQSHSIEPSELIKKRKKDLNRLV